MRELLAKILDRMQALGVFSGIAVAAVAGFELVISGGLDPLTPRALAEAPSEYDEQTVMQAWHYRPYRPTAFVTEAGQYLGYPIDDAVLDRLAGGPDDPTAPEAPVVEDTHDEGGLYEEIERLYASPESVSARPEEGAAPKEELPQWSDEQVVESLPYEEYFLEDGAMLEPLPTIDPPPVDTARAYGSASPS